MNDGLPIPRKSFAEAAQEFDPTPETVKMLLPYKDKITELRRKGASYSRIARMLENDDIHLSRMSITRFCQRIVGEKSELRRHAKSPKTIEQADVQSELEAKRRALIAEVNSQKVPSDIIESSFGKRGPRIADSKNL